MKDLPRVVFDCNVLLQAAARERSVAVKCLNLAESGLIQLCLSREVLAEVEDVLNRNEKVLGFLHILILSTDDLSCWAALPLVSSQTVA